MMLLFDMMLVLVLVLDIYLLGTARIDSMIRTVSVQGVLLAMMPVLIHQSFGWEPLAMGLIMMGLKGILIPWMLFYAMREVNIRKDVEPMVGFGVSMFLGGLAAALSLAFARYLPMAPGSEYHLVLPAAFVTVLSGFILMSTRLKAMSQVLGYLVLENGIFIFGLLLFKAVPILVEVGVLLDLLVAIFVMGIVLDHIRREFSSISTRGLSALKEE